MPYASQTDFSTIYGEKETLDLSDRNGTGTADRRIIEAALTQASSEIDSYLRILYGYLLPLENPPHQVIDLTCIIARYRLWKDKPSEKVRMDYEYALKTLDRIVTGRIRLPIDIPGATTNVGCSMPARTAAYTEAVMRMMP